MIFHRKIGFAFCLLSWKSLWGESPTSYTHRWKETSYCQAAEAGILCLFKPVKFLLLPFPSTHLPCNCQGGVRGLDHVAPPSDATGWFKILEQGLRHVYPEAGPTAFDRAYSQGLRCPPSVLCLERTREVWLVVEADLSDQWLLLFQWPMWNGWAGWQIGSSSIGAEQPSCFSFTPQLIKHLSFQ